jgi:hypothetical protein
VGPGGGDDQHVGAGGFARLDAGLGVLEHQAVGDIEAQGRGGLQIAGRVWLAAFDVLGGDHDGRRGHACGPQPSAREGD